MIGKVRFDKHGVAERKLVKCHWCLSEIQYGARICLECKRHQSKLWEYGKMLLTVSSVVGVVATAAVYISEQLVQLYDSVQTPAIEIVSFSSEGDLVVSNTSRRSVKVLHVMASTKSPSALSRTLVDQELSKFNSLSVDTRSARTRQANENRYDDGLNIANLPDEIVSFSGCSPDAKLVIMSKNSYDFLATSQYIEKKGSVLNSREATCEIFYTPGAIKSGMSFDCVALLGVYGPVKEYVRSFRKFEAGGGVCK